nr:hypothetical protein [Actinomycetales bacterium]
MSFYTVQVENARSAVTQARSTWVELKGIEEKLTGNLSSAAAATKEAKIIAALDQTNYQFVRPFVVTMFAAGNQALDGADQIITIFENASSDQAANALQAVTDAQEQVEAIGILPEYTYTPPQSIGPAPAKSR